MIALYHSLGSYLRSFLELPEPKAEQVRLKTAVNDSGEMSFILRADNPEYGLFCSMESEIILKEDGEETWRGRVTEQELDELEGTLTVRAKGILDYLHDTVQPCGTYSGTPQEVLQSLLTIHNSKPIPERKKFTLGTVTVTAQIKEFPVQVGTKTWKAVGSLVREYGGYLLLRRTQSGYVVDWLEEITEVCTQSIRLGENLLSLRQHIETDKLATVLYGYGKTTDDAPLGLESVCDGVGYVSDAEAVAVFGWIEDTYTDSSCVDAAALKTATEFELQKRLSETRAIELTAVDLADVRTDAERIRVGVLVPVEAASVNTALPCLELDRNLLEPEKTKIALSASLRTLSGMIGGTYDY